MAKFFNSRVLDYGLTEVTTNGNRLVLLKTYTFGDSYATVNTTNNIGFVAVSGADMTLESNGNARRIVVAAKTITGATDSGAAPDLHVAIVDTVNSRVLVVTDETSDQQIFNGNDVNVPTWNITMNQPV